MPFFQDSIQNEYLSLLRQWAKGIQPYIFTPADRPDLSYYGDGTNGWGVQTNQKAFAALAVLAKLDCDEGLHKIALALLRYSLESHITGSYHVTDGENVRWGHTWISVLGIERMIHGIDALWEDLSQEDLGKLREVLISESQWLYGHHPLQADPVFPNVPESNYWNGAVMIRTAFMYPDCPMAAQFLERGTAFLLNAVSVPSDQDDITRLYAGKSLADWHVGANFFESMALNHHGYMNVGYMVICVSNAAMLHFSLRKWGLPVPPAVYHNMDRLWQLIKTCLYDDGRLLRIGGDTRVRYCYCQDYLIPALNFAADALGEDIDQWERGWISTLKKEFMYNNDRSFLSKRCELFVEKSPLYYTRLESDRACCIAFSAYWRYVFHNFKVPAGTGAYAANKDFLTPLPQWNDPYHGAYFVRDRRRFASFVWLAAERPTGLCLPPDDSSLAEWQHNMTSVVYGDGITHDNVVISHGGHMLSGGFVTYGRYLAHTKGLLAEQLDEEDTVQVRLAFAALPDGHTVVTLQYADAIKTCHISEVYGLHLLVPNDVFNDFTRLYTEGDRWISIDDRYTAFSLYGDPLTLHRQEGRQIGLTHGWSNGYRYRGFLHCDEICSTKVTAPRFYEKAAPVFDFGCAVVTDVNAAKADAVRAQFRTLDVDLPLVRAVRVIGLNNRSYWFVANFSDAAALLDLPEIGPVCLDAGTAEVFEDRSDNQKS